MNQRSKVEQIFEMHVSIATSHQFGLPKIILVKTKKMTFIVQIFWENHKHLKKISLFWRFYSSKKVNQSKFQIKQDVFMAFSQYPTFDRPFYN